MVAPSSAANTFASSVTSASASIPSNLVSSAVRKLAVVASKTALCACILVPISSPVMTLPFRSRVPPSWGVVSSTIFDRPPPEASSRTSWIAAWTFVAAIEPLGVNTTADAAGVPPGPCMPAIVAISAGA